VKARADSERVSPTAYATGYFWYRHGLSHPGLLVPEGERHDRGFRLLIGMLRAVGVHFDALMISRHVGIDTVLARHVDAGKVTQVVELAAGLTPRGWRFKQRYGTKLAYVETDLPHMAKMKRGLLEKSKLGTPGHRVETVNVLLDDGPGSLAQLADTLDPKAGVAVITEGLMAYLDPPTAQQVWKRIATMLKRFPRGVYLADAYVKTDRYGIAGKVFRGIVSRVVGGRMYVHFDSLVHAERVLAKAGFAQVTLHKPDTIEQTREFAAPRGGNRVRILEAVV
jgi:O-methyltransferase involved in polyketide biosynthesis